MRWVLQTGNKVWHLGCCALQTGNEVWHLGCCALQTGNKVWHLGCCALQTGNKVLHLGCCALQTGNKVWHLGCCALQTGKNCVGACSKLKTGQSQVRFRRHLVTLSQINVKHFPVRGYRTQFNTGNKFQGVFLISLLQPGVLSQAASSSFSGCVEIISRGRRQDRFF